MTQGTALTDLEAQVLETGLCVRCGACVSLCPYLGTYNGRIVVLDHCRLDHGRCYTYCPRTKTDLLALRRSRFGDGANGGPLGHHLSLAAARATAAQTRDRAQTGGLASALMELALEEGLIDRAVLTAPDDTGLPVGRQVSSADDVAACAGSSYAAGPTLAALNRLDGPAEETIGLVGLPCQATALASVGAADLEPQTAAGRVGLVIGLFCTWALDGRRFRDFLADKAEGRAIVKTDITPPPTRSMKLELDDGQELEFSLDLIREFIQPGCALCPDMTAELADISVGTIEGRPGWNTVIVRSDKGKQLLDRAVATGRIEVNDYRPEHRQGLEAASRLKRRRAVTAAEADGRSVRELFGYDALYTAQIKEKAGEEK